MKKSRKITLIILAILISISLAMLAVLSGTLAKYISTGQSMSAARAAKWGMQFNAGSDLQHFYTTSLDTDNPNVRTTVVEAKTNGQVDSNNNPLYDNTVVPGTNGSLAWIHISGKPEVKYDINISTSEVKEGDTVLYRGFNVGEGFYENSRLIRDEKGLPIEYFPIIIELCAYNVDSAGQKTSVEVVQTHALKKQGDNTQSTDANKLYTSLSELVTGVNTSISNLFDSVNNEPNKQINRYYSVNWKWNYEPASASAYQSNFLDTALCEAVANCKDKSVFEIGVKFEMQVSQSN